MSISSLSTPFSPRSPSRTSSRGSFRSPSPGPFSSSDDPVAIRNYIATLKHSIRQQTAQLHSLENIVLSGPRPYPPGIMSLHSPSSSTVDSSTVDLTSESTPPTSISHDQRSSRSSHRMSKRSSFEKLHIIAGPDSNLPLPMRECSIREGVPMEFGDAKPGHHKRVSSPTRTYSRIPKSSVGNARALADEGTSAPPPSSSNRASLMPSLDISSSTVTTGQSSPSLPPASPSTKRMSLTPGGTTKVLADLQAGVINARHALENTKAQLRVSQRSVAQLTRQTEDLKEGRERLRLENEGLNNVVARKERLLQEVLERARKAEAEAASLKAQLKSETTASKKSIREMEHALTESTALSQKSEREYITLRESLKSMTESWKHDTDRLRDEMTKREDRLKAEAEAMGKKYKKLLQELGKEDGKEKESIKSLREQDERLRKQIEEAFREEIGSLRKDMDKVSVDGEEANQTAKTLALELTRLRRMMQAAGRDTVKS